MMYCQVAVTVSDRSQIGEARRETNRAAQSAGLNEAEAGSASIIAMELATNLQLYATGGELLIRSYAIGGAAGIELLSIDSGPGIASVQQCLEDGYSTGGTPGNGLGAVRRLSTEFDIYSSQPGGTVILARVEKGRAAGNGKPTSLAWGAVNRPAPREVISGDTWRISERGGGWEIMIADGLGHGPLASEAAELAGRTFDDGLATSPADFLILADRRLRGTRGAAVAVARLSPTDCVLTFAGIGNIAGSLRSTDTLARGLMSHNGIVGAQMRKVQQFDYPCGPNSLIVMNSDGLQSRWTPDAYSGLASRHPAVIASVLYRDFRRGTDDVTVCVVRSAQGS